jgi:hypothetical protein
MPASPKPRTKRSTYHKTQTPTAPPWPPNQEVLVADYPFAYIRGGSHLIVVNPRRDPAQALVPELGGRIAKRIEGAGVDVDRTRISAAGFGWAIFSLS